MLLPPSIDDCAPRPPCDAIRNYPAWLTYDGVRSRPMPYPTFWYADGWPWDPRRELVNTRRLLTFDDAAHWMECRGLDGLAFVPALYHPRAMFIVELGDCFDVDGQLRPEIVRAVVRADYAERDVTGKNAHLYFRSFNVSDRPSLLQAAECCLFAVPPARRPVIFTGNRISSVAEVADGN